MNLVERAKNILLTPKTEWPAIGSEAPNAGQIIVEYVIPLAAVSAVAQLLGYGLIGMGPVPSFTWGIATGLTTFVSALLGVYIVAFIIDFLAPNFGSEKNFGRSLQLVAYSYTPTWVAGVLYVIPALGILVAIAGFYGLYLLYLGLPIVKKTPQDKVVVYLVVTIVAVIVVSVVVGIILTPIFVALFGLSVLSGAKF